MKNISRVKFMSLRAENQTQRLTMNMEKGGKNPINLKHKVFEQRKSNVTALVETSHTL